MPLSLRARRVAIRCAYVALRVYWFLVRPQLAGVKCAITYGDDVLLVRHTYRNRFWDLPGGGIRRREAPVDAARREMNEELGRWIEDWDDLGELSVRKEHHRDTMHLFHARLGDRRIEHDRVEIDRAEWFRRDALPADVGPYVRRILAHVTNP